MTSPFLRLCGGCVVAAVLASSGPGHARSTGRRATGAEFRRHAAEFKKLRHVRQHDREWNRRFEATVNWFFDHAEIVSDGRRSCAEIERRLGPPDPLSPLDLDVPLGRRHQTVLVYSATTQDAIGGGRIALQLNCHEGKTTSMELDVKAS